MEGQGPAPVAKSLAESILERSKSRGSKAADVIDSDPGMGTQVTKRMLKKAAKEANPPEPKIPEFLKHFQKSGKRFRDAEGNIKMAFQPEWGISEQDSIFGSSLLAKDWYKCSITPIDRVNLMATKDIEEYEQLGAMVAYQLTGYLQTSI